MLIFRLFFILADKISRFAKSWLLIQNLNSVALSEIPYLNWRYDFVTFSHNFCQNAWTSSLCTHPNNDVFSISTVVIATRNAQVPFHMINSWISSILEISACIFSLGNLCNVQFHVDHILWAFVHTWKTMFFWINIMILWTRKTQGLFHYINSWIFSVLKIPVCIFFFRNSCNIQFYVDHILLAMTKKIW